ncbi:unnamed protein product [Eruca vesicaria subsp. sativa]|uniref:Uncharacterized protein n=1 Tax=Eruca vesicaria subsp. sativa TaxID=29727 RepID=A0ABC8K7W2_ERUVS|nr:unnamed protein product [Eruca vesicaria subsp. sativa]
MSLRVSHNTSLDRQEPMAAILWLSRFKEKNGCKFFAQFDEEDRSLWQKRALIEARDEIREKSRVIEQLNKTIAELRSNLEKIQNEEEIVRKFEEFYV